MRTATTGFVCKKNPQKKLIMMEIDVGKYVRSSYLQ